MRRFVPALVLLSAGFAASVPVAGADEARSLDDCEGLVLDKPDDRSSYACFTRIARRLRQYEDAMRRLEAHLAVEPDNHAARLQLAWLELDRGTDRAESLFREAAEGFASADDPGGEVDARMALSYLLRRTGRGEAASEENARAWVVAEREGDAAMIGAVRNAQAQIAYDRGDFEIAQERFKEGEALLFPDGPSDLQGYILTGLGNIAARTGQDRLAMEYYDRQADLMGRTGNLHQEALVRHNIAFLAFRHLADWSMTPDEARALAREALDVAVRGGNREVEGALQLMLGRDVETPLAERIVHVERALEIQRTLGHVRGTIAALRQLAQYRVRADPDDPQAAFDVADEAVELARGTGSLPDIARARTTAGEVRRKAGHGDAGIEASLAALDAVENIRDLQRDDLVRARYLARWDFNYYRFSGYLLDRSTSSRSSEEIDLAFNVIERLRARVLLDSLDAAGAAAAAAGSGPLQEERDAVLGRITAVQKQLINPQAPEEQRSGWLADLEALEQEERRLRSEIAAASPGFASLRRPEFPSLVQVQAALADDEAMLAYQLSTRVLSATKRMDNGGSWLFVVSNRDVEVLPLPERDDLEDAVEAFLGLLERRDGSEENAATSLYDLLLREALAAIPVETTRLVIVPDEILHRLPFSALRESDGGPPLAATHEITIAPSATIWMRWSDPETGDATIPVLSLADPTLVGAAEIADAERQATLAVGLQLGRLPRAREEARAMVAALGGRGTLLTGVEASERFVKSTRLRDFRIVHFAAHAVVDDEHPERSAILLAPGSEDEDGLLQIREIVDLDLDGQIVILSACRSASGQLVTGEGVIGLGRAFLQAGARAVIGGLWPLRDDEVARLIKDFSGHLGEGARVSAALAAAQRDGIRRGAPASAWAGLVLHGDGDLVPVPGGVVAGSGGRIQALAGTLLALALVALLYLRYSRRPRVG